MSERGGIAAGRLPKRGDDIGRRTGVDHGGYGRAQLRCGVIFAIKVATRSAAGIARERATPCPAQSDMKSATPCLPAALRIGRVRSFCCRNGRIALSLPAAMAINPLVSPRAGRPEKARVMTVVSFLASRSARL